MAERDIGWGGDHVTVRLRPDQARALRLHAAMRRIDRREPASVQAIVEVALDEWLKANGPSLRIDMGPV